MDEFDQADLAVEQNISDMDNIKSDIQSHIDKIINQIKLKAFDNIIS